MPPACYTVLPLRKSLIPDTLKIPAGGEWFLVQMTDREMGQLEQIRKQRTESQREMEELFRSFCHTIGIKERTNLHLQKQFVPDKFRHLMPEF